MSRFDAFKTILNRPHMAHANNTLLRKELNVMARDEETAYKRYMRKVDAAKAEGWLETAIIHELEGELLRIQEDKRWGDELYQQGLENAKYACSAAIRRIISEIKGEN